MLALQNSPYAKLARRSLDDDPHFLTRITDMADHRDILCADDVYTRQGILLIGKNALVSSKLREDLFRHKLPMDRLILYQQYCVSEIERHDLDFYPVTGYLFGRVAAPC